METPAALPTPADAANGSSADAASNATVPTAKTPLERLTEAVDKNPLDFNSWVSLLALVQSEVRAIASRTFQVYTMISTTLINAQFTAYYWQATTPRETVEATYDRFLAEFPLCFGYWNKVWRWRWPH